MFVISYRVEELLEYTTQGEFGFVFPRPGGWHTRELPMLAAWGMRQIIDHASDRPVGGMISSRDIRIIAERMALWPIDTTSSQYRSWPAGSHVAVGGDPGELVLVVDCGGEGGRWGGLCGILGLQVPQGTFEFVEGAEEGRTYVQYKESEEEKKWAEKIDRIYLRILMRKDPDKFLAEMTPNSKHDGVCVGLDLQHPHHQNLQKEFQKDVCRICKEKGLNDHPALMMESAVARKIENANQPRSSKELYNKKVVSRQKKDSQMQNDNSPTKRVELCRTIQ